MTITPIIKKIIIISIITVILGITYLYFFGNNKPVNNSSLSSSSTGGQNINEIDAKIASDTAFLSTLLGLSNINIDATLFSSKPFNSLKDNNVPIVDDGISGRANPFAPLDSIAQEATAFDSVITATGPVVTIPATQITDSSAILSGSVSAGLKTQSIYFEWGPVPTLGQKTSNATQSSVGTFSKSLTGLSPKTTYYFKTVALVGKNVVVGDISSFTTN